MKEVTLYKNHGVDVGVWSIKVCSDSDSLESDAWLEIHHSTSLQGKKVMTHINVSPKNVGRSNETTPLQQAKLELDSRVRAQLDKGYVRSLEAAKAPATNGLGLPQPMLAMPIEKVKDIDWEHAYAQPKLDGHRMLSDGRQCWSRGGKRITTMDHIQAFLAEAGIDRQNVILDGELYVHGLELWNIGSLVKKRQAGSESVVWHVYDLISDAPFEQRYEQLQGIFHSLRNRFDLATIPIKLVRTRKVVGQDQADKFHFECCAQGFEGAMLRWGKEGYKPGKRVKYLSKIKSFSDAEFKIIGVVEGQGRYIKTADVPEDKLVLTRADEADEASRYLPKGIWVLRTNDGRTFKATIQGNMWENAALFHQHKRYLGRLLTVKYIYLSPDGIPQLPVSKSFYSPV